MKFPFDRVVAPLIRSILPGLLLLCTAPPVQAETRYMQYDLYELNGHSGFLSAWAINGPLDKVIVVVPGFDAQNNGRPIDDLTDDFAPFVTFLAPGGWDIVLMDYVDGTIDIRDNADNLAHFMEVVHYFAARDDYYLAILSGSMGGIVARTMFVQENSSMGVDTYVSIDSPHWGVYLSDWAGDLAALAIDYEAAHQMYHGDRAYDELYDWLYAVEHTDYFKRHVNGPMNTCAIALSDGTQDWKVYWGDLLLHNKYWPVSSFIDVQGLRSTYMPYHSTMYLDDYSTDKESHWNRDEYRYNNLHSSYFDKTIANPQDAHGAPFHTISQGLIYIVEHEPAEVAPQPPPGC